jgi:hypothetical protein
MWTPFVGDYIEMYASTGFHTIELKNGSCISAPLPVLIKNENYDIFDVTFVGSTVTSCGWKNGTITLNIHGAMGKYKYSLDGGVTFTEFTTTATPGVCLIEHVAAGIYNIIIGKDDCFLFHINNVRVYQGLDNSSVTPPEATSPQSFCNDATVNDLQTINGIDILWFDVAVEGIPLSLTTPLIDEAIYYVSQSPGCARTAVKVLSENIVFIDAPNLPGIFDLCAPATLANIPTYGNANLVWYATATSAAPLPLTTPLVDEASYFVAQSGGSSCVTALRREVVINLITGKPNAPTMQTPQYFCSGALVGNLETPHDQILWYAESWSDTPLENDVKLETGVYYASQQIGGDCESELRTPVWVYIGTFPAPTVMPKQCYEPGMTLSDLTITGVGIKWYDDEVGGDPLPLDTPIDIMVKDSYWAAQSSASCESERVKITVVIDCYEPFGTVFPFVHTDDNVYNKLFTTTAKLYMPPPTGTVDKVGYVRKQTPLKTIVATHYDCTDDPIEGAPLNPGIIGATNNPGLPINWSLLGIAPGTINHTTDECPVVSIGRYAFEKVAPGDYILEISRQGFLSRYARINIKNSGYLEHREILGGDVNGDGMINEKDLSTIRTKMSMYGNSLYNVMYDFDGNKNINNIDISIIRLIFGTYSTFYEETDEFINH